MTPDIGNQQWPRDWIGRPISQLAKWCASRYSDYGHWLALLASYASTDTKSDQIGQFWGKFRNRRIEHETTSDRKDSQRISEHWYSPSSF